MTQHPKQFGFDDLLIKADTDNKARAFSRETAHLPETFEKAIPFHYEQIEQHHRAMLEINFETAIGVRKDAHLLARKLNGNKPGIIADENASGCILARETAAPIGTIPLWGQDGTFRMQAAGMELEASMHGMFGIGATAMPFCSFEARAVETEKPFLSSTGYRSFLGVSVSPWEGMTTEDFVRRVIELYCQKELGGSLLRIAT